MSRRVQQCPVVVGRRQQTHCAPSGRSRVRIAAWFHVKQWEQAVRKQG